MLERFSRCAYFLPTAGISKVQDAESSSALADKFLTQCVGNALGPPHAAKGLQGFQGFDLES
jgi:hypothetical protein